MGRNSLAGTKKGKSRTARFYQKNKKARDKKKRYDNKYHSTAFRRAYRSLLNIWNRKNKSKKGDGKDASHKKNGKMTKEGQSKNRARKGKK